MTGSEPGLPVRAGQTPPGTTLLVSTPTEADGLALAARYLGQEAGGGVGFVVVSTDRSPAVMREALADAGVPPARTAVVDARAGATGDGERVIEAGGAGDLTGIGIGVTRALNELSAAGATEPRVLVDSLSTMAAHVDREALFRFCHLLGARVRSVDGRAALTVVPDSHDEVLVHTLRRAADGLLEVETTEREGPARARARVRGVDAGPDGW